MENKIISPGRPTSSQKSIHSGLERIVRRHMSQAWRQPIHKPTQDAWDRLKRETNFSSDCKFILDSGCGTGTSSRYLASQNPRVKILGVDQSLSRLSKNGLRDGILVDGNLILLRAELSSLWRLMLAEGYRPALHFILYPNPWPKPGHLKRRWHAHPVFPDMLALGGEVEMRCNWRIYAQEFAFASSLVCDQDIQAHSFEAETPITLFEEKYQQRGHDLYCVKIPAATCAAFADRRFDQGKLSSSEVSTASTVSTGTGSAGGGV